VILFPKEPVEYEVLLAIMEKNFLSMKAPYGVRIRQRSKKLALFKENQDDFASILNLMINHNNRLDQLIDPDPNSPRWRAVFDAPDKSTVLPPRMWTMAWDLLNHPERLEKLPAKVKHLPRLLLTYVQYIPTVGLSSVSYFVQIANGQIDS
jgi:hypothetical protein